MQSKLNYPYNEALDDLEKFFKKHIKDPNTLDSLLHHIEECRAAKRLGFRYFHKELMDYRERFSDYFRFSDEERKMIDDLLYFWA